MKTELEEKDLDAIAIKVAEHLKPLLSKNATERAADDTIFTVEGLANHLSVSDQWVYERVHLGEIPFTKVGKFNRFRKQDIDKWLESQTTPASTPLSRPLKMVK